MGPAESFALAKDWFEREFLRDENSKLFEGLYDEIDDTSSLALSYPSSVPSPLSLTLV